MRYRAELGLPTTTSSSPPRHVVVSTAGGRRATARKDFGAAASLLERARRAAAARTRSTSRWSSSSPMPSTSRAGATRRVTRVRVAHRALAARRATGRASSRESSRQAYVLQDLEPEGATERLDALIAVRCRKSRRPATTIALVHRPLRARDGGVPPRRAERALEAFELAAAPCTLSWRSRTSSWAGVPWPACTARRPSQSCSCGSTRTSRVRAANDWLRASRAVALAMLGRFEEARAILPRRANRAGGARPEPPARAGSRDRIHDRRAPGRGSGDGRGVRVPRGAGSTRSSSDESFFSTAAARFAEALYELGRLDEADAWAARGRELGERRCLHIRCYWRSGEGEGARAPRRCDGRRSASRARRSRSPRRPRTTTGQGDAYAGLAEVLLLAGKPDEAAAPPRDGHWSGTSARRTRLVRRARAAGSGSDGARDASRRPGPSRAALRRPAPRPRAPARTFPTCWLMIGCRTRWPIEPTGPAIFTSASHAIEVVSPSPQRVNEVVMFISAPTPCPSR